MNCFLMHLNSRLNLLFIQRDDNLFFSDHFPHFVVSFNPAINQEKIIYQRYREFIRFNPLIKIKDKLVPPILVSMRLTCSLPIVWIQNSTSIIQTLIHSGFNSQSYYKGRHRNGGIPDIYAFIPFVQDHVSSIEDLLK